MIGAGIILYNPDIQRLEENLKAICNQVRELFLVDNYSDNIKEIDELLNKFDNVKLIRNNSNIGVAAALNQIISHSMKEKFEWVITLDQDSICNPKLINEYRKYIGMNNIGMATCNIIDRNIPSDFEEDTMEEFTFVESCITSGSLVNISACQKVGGFDNDLFIDYVDFDMCARMLASGYKIMKINYNGLLHEVGKASVKYVFGKKQIIYHHSAFRKYYIARNGIYYIRKYKTSVNYRSSIKPYLRLYKQILLSLLFEKQKCHKIKSSLKGLVDGYKMDIK